MVIWPVLPCLRLAGFEVSTAACTIPSRDYGPEYGRESAGGVCPCTKAGLPCDVMVTLLEVKPDALAVMTLVPE